MSEPEYHKQPITQDPTKPDIPEDAPLAQGHDRDLADEVRDADAEHTETVKAEAEAAEQRVSDGESAEVGARAPGDHAGEAEGSAGSSREAAPKSAKKTPAKDSD